MKTYLSIAFICRSPVSSFSSGSTISNLFAASLSKLRPKMLRSSTLNSSKAQKGLSSRSYFCSLLAVLNWFKMGLVILSRGKRAGCKWNVCCRSFKRVLSTPSIHSIYFMLMHFSRVRSDSPWPSTKSSAIEKEAA